jgi:PPOX class probable F420-dependent enzyme
MDLKVRKLFQGKNLIFIATINLDGSPQLTPVWGNYTDEYILINTAEGRLKHKNIQRDPRVAVSVVDHDNPLNMTTIRGKVVQIIPDYDYTHINKLAKQYMGTDEYPYKKESERRITIKIKPEKIFVMPDIS